MKKSKILLSIGLLILLSACSTPDRGLLPVISMTATSSQIPSTNEGLSVVIATSTATELPTIELPGEVLAANIPTPTMAAEAWKTMPIVPLVSERMVEIYRTGLEDGRDPTHFSKIGDCQNITTYFLASFDNPKYYRLGAQYSALQPTIDHFKGSWSRQSLAVRGGLNVAAALNPIWADPKLCESGETPLACEIRVYNPSIVTISMEESWSGDIVKYDMYLRKIIEYVLSQNIVPILATRAELPGSSKSINETVARIAYDTQVPLWNFWAATISLPYYGLTEDGFHLTQARDFFDDPASMEGGWPWRNLTALEAIDAVYRAVNGQP